MIVRQILISLHTTTEGWIPFLSKNLMMQNEGGGCCGQSMQPEACNVCQKEGQTESFKLGITGEAEIPQEPSKQVVAGKLKARGDGNRRDIAINKTKLK